MSTQQSDPFQPLEETLQEILRSDEEAAFDYEDRKGNEAARSHIYAMRRFKGDVERTRKAEKAAYLEAGRKVDVRAASLVGNVEPLIARHQEQIDAIEKREEERVAAITAEIDQLAAMGRGRDESGRQKTLDELLAAQQGLEGQNITEERFGEFYEEAITVVDAAKAEVAQEIVDERLRVEEREELARLRQAQKEREEREAAEAAERETRERAAREAAEVQERKRQEELAEARRAREEAEQKARDAEQRAENAAREERERIEREQREAEEAEERRQAEARAQQEAKQYRADVIHEAVDTLQAAAEEAEIALTPQQCERIIHAIEAGKVTRVTLDL